MKKNSKLFLISSVVFSLLMFTACTGGVSVAEANKKVTAAFEKTATTRIDSFAFDLDAGLDLSLKSLEEGVEVDSMGVKGDISLGLKVNDLWTADLQASLVVDADLSAKENGEVVSELDAAAYAYVNEGFFYVDLSEAQSFIEELIGKEITMALKGKGEMPGPLAELLEYDPDEVFELPFDQEQLLSYVSEINGVTASIKNGEAIVTYKVTVEDIANIYIKTLLDSEMLDSEMPDSEMPDSEDVSSIKAEFLEMLNQVLRITTAEITIGVGRDGFISKLYLDLDAGITIPVDEDPAMKIDFKGHVHIDIKNINKTISIAFPADLDSYPDFNFEG